MRLNPVYGSSTSSWTQRNYAVVPRVALDLELVTALACPLPALIRRIHPDTQPAGLSST